MQLDYLVRHYRNKHNANTPKAANNNHFFTHVVRDMGLRAVQTIVYSQKSYTATPTNIGKVKLISLLQWLYLISDIFTFVQYQMCRTK